MRPLANIYLNLINIARPAATKLLAGSAILLAPLAASAEGLQWQPHRVAAAPQTAQYEQEIDEPQEEVVQTSHQQPARTARAAKRPTQRVATQRLQRSTAAANRPTKQAVATNVNVDAGVKRAGHFYGEPACGCGDVGCGMGMGEISCGLPEPGCAVMEPGCGIVEPGCGIGMEPGCGCGDVGCGGACGIGCGDSCGADCDNCFGGCLGGCVDRGAVPIGLYLPPIKEIALFAGVHGFKGPLDEGRDRGNFGFHEGINAGGKMAWLPWPGLAYQLGYQATHSQLSGSENGFTSDSHTQQFFTAGLFRRNFAGLQYGVVYDLLQDERQVQGGTDFSQIRGLISFTNPKGGEIGFMFTSANNNEVINGSTWEATDQYLGFYRYHGPSGGEFRLFGGGASGSKAVFGADLFAPLNERWSINTGFTYLMPDESVRGSGSTEEGWNLGMNLVWHWGCRAKKWYKSPWRPMFNVADNGSMIIDDVN